MFPVLFEWHSTIFYSYPVFFGMAWATGYFFSLNSLKTRGLSTKGFNYLFFGTSLFSWIGAKLFFILLSSKSLNFSISSGLIFYGGLIFGTLFILFYTLFLQKFKLTNCHLFLPALCISHAIGRVGCFLAGCCYGCLTRIPLGEWQNKLIRHPVQIYEFFSLVLLGLFLNKLIKKRSSFVLITLTYFISYSFIRFVLEFFRGDKIRGIYFLNLSTSQYISLIIFLASLATIFIKRRETNDKKIEALY